MTTLEPTARRDAPPPDDEQRADTPVAYAPTALDPLAETAISQPDAAVTPDPSDVEDDPPFDEDADSAEDSFADVLAQIAHAPDIPIAAAVHEPQVPEPGMRLGDQFEIIRRLGEGGMGVVFLARDLLLGRQVAIKVLKVSGRTVAQRAELLKAFERDGAATARLRHPNVITIYHLGFIDGAPVLVLELLDGQELSELLAERRLGTLEIVQLATQVARALVHAHAHGVVHRDLKPQNVFVQTDGVVKVLDFGLAALDVGSGPAGEGSARYGGTPAYMAPEQWRGLDQDGRCDVWALGVMIYQMACGDLPFATIHEVLADTPAPLPSAHPEVDTDVLDGVVARALAARPEARFESASAMLEALEDIELELIAPATAQTPYRYLEPFTEQDEAWFFGRERESHRVIGLLPTRAMVAVIGPSGAGKSSLVRAGVIPRLLRQGARWRCVTVRPARRPIEAFHAALIEACGESARSLVPTPEALAAAPGRAGQALRQLARDEDVRVLVVVDQFEELYTRCDDADQRAAFAQALLSCADDTTSPTRAILTLREDFLTRLSEHRELRDCVVAHLFPLGPPDPQNLTEALVEPARRLGYRFEEGLAEAMVAELRDEAAPLPLMQFAVSQLWERRDRHRRALPRAVLTDLGGVAGILARHADTVVSAIKKQGNGYYAEELLCRLVTAEGTRQSADREALLGMFADRTRATQTMDQLVTGRLLTSSRGAAHDIVELAHDALISRWELLDDWLHERREGRVFHQRLAARAQDWDSHGRSRSLLLRDEALKEMLVQQQRLLVALTDVERDFLLTSETTGTRRRRWTRAAILAALATAALIAGGSWAALIEIDAQRVRAEAGLAETQREKARAETARLQAEQLAEGMLFELSDELEPLGRLDLLEHIAHAVNTYLDETAPGSDAPQQRALRQRGVTMRILGDLQRTSGNLARSEEDYRQSRVALEALVAVAPRDANAHRDLCITLRRIGGVIAERGDFDNAMALYQQALEVIVPWGTAYNAAPRDQEELAQTHYAIGNVELEREHVEQAVDHYAEGQTLFRRLIKRQPDNPAFQRGLAVGYEKLGDVALQTHDVEGARDHYDKALEQTRALTESDPRNVRWKRDLAVLYERLGDVAIERGQHAEARDLHARSLDIVALLHQLDPTNTSSQRDMAISHEKLGDAEAELGNLQSALESYSRSLAYTRRLAESDPGNITWQRDLSITLERTASLQRQLGRLNDAETTYAEALALRRRVAASNLDHDPWRYDLALLLRTVGQLDLQRHTAAQARAHLDEAIAELGHLVDRDPDALDARLALARTLWLRATELDTTPTARHDHLARAERLLQELHDLSALDAEEEALRTLVTDRLAAPP